VCVSLCTLACVYVSTSTYIHTYIHTYTHTCAGATDNIERVFSCLDSSSVGAVKEEVLFLCVCVCVFMYASTCCQLEQ
jgi:hypothetical protein